MHRLQLHHDRKTPCQELGCTMSGTGWESVGTRAHATLAPWNATSKQIASGTAMKNRAPYPNPLQIRRVESAAYRLNALQEEQQPNREAVVKLLARQLDSLAPAAHCPASDFVLPTKWEPELPDGQPGEASIVLRANTPESFCYTGKDRHIREVDAKQLGLRIGVVSRDGWDSFSFTGRTWKVQFVCGLTTKHGLTSEAKEAIARCAASAIASLKRQLRRATTRRSELLE